MLSQIVGNLSPKIIEDINLFLIVMFLMLNPCKSYLCIKPYNKAYGWFKKPIPRFATELTMYVLLCPYLAYSIVRYKFSNYSNNALDYYYFESFNIV